jgi:6-phosphogluconolactonase
VFAPDKKTAYLVGELSSTVSVLDYDLTTGSFHLLQTVSTIPDDWTEHNGAAAIRISNDGRFVYVSNRGHNSLAVFEVLDGELKLIQHLTTHGDFPRDFALDPTERFILVANQNTDNATLYTRDQETGLLACCQKDIPLPEGVCVYFK